MTDKDKPVDHAMQKPDDPTTRVTNPMDAVDTSLHVAPKEEPKT